MREVTRYETIDEFILRGGQVTKVIKRTRGPFPGVAAEKKVKFKKWDTGAAGGNKATKVYMKTKGHQNSRGTKFSVKGTPFKHLRRLHE